MYVYANAYGHAVADTCMWYVRPVPFTLVALVLFSDARKDGENHVVDIYQKKSCCFGDSRRESPSWTLMLSKLGLPKLPLEP